MKMSTYYDIVTNALVQVPATAMTLKDLKALSRRCWRTVRAELGLPPVAPSFEAERGVGRRLGDHECVRRKAFLLDQQLNISLKAGDNIDAYFLDFARAIKARRPTAAGPLVLPQGVEFTFRMRCGRDSLSIRCVHAWVMGWSGDGPPGWRTRFDILVAGKRTRRRR